MSVVHPVVCNPVISPVVDILNFVGWRAGGSSLPRLDPGEKFLTDDTGAYLTDENGAYLTGEEA
jgi:hypothetical protein